MFFLFLSIQFSIFNNLLLHNGILLVLPKSNGIFNFSVDLKKWAKFSNIFWNVVNLHFNLQSRPRLIVSFYWHCTSVVVMAESLLNCCFLERSCSGETLRRSANANETPTFFTVASKFASAIWLSVFSAIWLSVFSALFWTGVCFSFFLRRH